MAGFKEIGIVNGFSFVAKGLERGFVEIDKQMGTVAKKPHERASTWLNIALGVAVPLVTVWGKVKAPWDVGLVVFGAHHATKVVDYIEEYAAAPAAGVGGEMGFQSIGQVMPTPTPGPPTPMPAIPEIVA